MQGTRSEGVLAPNVGRRQETCREGNFTDQATDQETISPARDPRLDSLANLMRLPYRYMAG